MGAAASTLANIPFTDREELTKPLRIRTNKGFLDKSHSYLDHGIDEALAHVNAGHKMDPEVEVLIKHCLNSFFCTNDAMSKMEMFLRAMCKEVPGVYI